MRKDAAVAASTTGEQQLTVLPIMNAGSTPLEIWLEPWGDLIHLPLGAAYLLQALGSKEPPRVEDRLTLEIQDASLKVWAERAVEELRVLDANGRLLWGDGTA